MEHSGRVDSTVNHYANLSEDELKSWQAMTNIPNEVKERAAIELARKHYSYYLRLVHHGNYEPLAHTELIASELQRIVDGEQRHIIIEMPPRHGKSLTVTETFPSYFVGKHPNKKVIVAAYGDGLARHFGRLNRNKFIEYAPKVFNVEIANDNGSVADWSVLDNNGGMISTGIGGQSLVKVLTVCQKVL